ncbi:MAG: flagellar hook-basal body complex protein [Ruminococcus sp.]|jgi:flagellar hook-basal body protein|nr:flagellar hook-basal body complex protein [Ruminococcus sp.]MBQ7008219.1 flagellar hook-basal body complex protein [Ruminococcus sp.]MBR4023418.1 flagellar hook-basal body complex protein [Ruminococcus sp.]
MLRGYYSAASGILVQQRNLNVIGNNITNASTVGYRAQRVIQSTFDQEVVSRYENGKYTTIGTGSQTNVVDTVETNFNESSIYETENPFDMAIISEGFFNISGDNGQTFMTRNGCFNIDAQGYLVLDGIGRVQGENGDIYVGGSDFSMDSLGNIYDINGNFAGKLRITIPAEEAQTIKMENGLFVTDNVTDVEVPKVINYGYERSNVNMNDEYTRLIEAQAAFRACSTALSMIDQMNGKSVSSIAAIN